MKKLVFLSIIFLITAGIISAQNSKQDFKLVNSTGVEIHQVFITPHDANEWGEDILGRDILENGQECDIQFHPKEDACMWDLRITDKEGNAIEWENIDLCKWSKITLKYDGQAATAEFE